MRCRAAAWLGALALFAAPAMAADHSPGRAVFVTLGTGGGPLPRLIESEPANALTVNDAVYRLDVGDGMQHQPAAAGLSAHAALAVFVSRHPIDPPSGTAARHAMAVWSSR